MPEVYRLEAISKPQHKESLLSDPISTIALWLDEVDKIGTQISTQQLTDLNLPHPLVWKDKYWFGQHQINLQLATIIVDLLENSEYFSPDSTKRLLVQLQEAEWKDGIPVWKKKAVKPQTAINKLIAKQKGYLEKGESLQFGKVGLEVSSQAQRVAYKLHALQELLEPFVGPGATKYEDQLADILTTKVMDKAGNFKALGQAIGPYRFSVRWQDFLEVRENPGLLEWINARSDLGNYQEYKDVLLKINATQSLITPGTMIQLLEKITFRSTGKVTPLRAGDVADPHFHNNKVELYLMLMGPGALKVKYSDDDKIHTFIPNPNVTPDIDLSLIGAEMRNGVPVLIYKGHEYFPDENGRFINLPLESGIAQFIVIRPGDIHDFTNVGISPASSYALTLGFPKEEGLSLEGDFIEQPKGLFIKQPTS